MAPDTKKTTNPNPLLRATYLSKLIFWWLRDVISHARQHDFVAEDLYDTNPKDLSEPLISSLESIWTKEVAASRKKNKRPSLWRAVRKAYGWDFMKLSLLPMIYTGLQIAYPQLFKHIIWYFQSKSNMTSQWMYLMVTIFITLIVMRSTFLSQGRYQLSRVGMRARIACTSLIYRKLIRLSPSAKQKLDSSVITLLSVDASKFDDLFTDAPFIVIVPVQLLIITYLISLDVGFFAATVGIALLILLSLPIQAVYSKVTLRFRAKQSTRTDYRISLISEIINGIRVVKMHVWEKYLEKLVFVARDLEIKNYVKISHLVAVIRSIPPLCHRLSIIAITLISELQHESITADKSLPVMQHLFNVRTSISFHFFQGVRYLTDMSVSMKRIEEFLLLEEVAISVKDLKDNANEAITIENVTALWDEKSVILQEIILDFAPKKLYAVVGSVGSGKSSLLQLILGELPKAYGKVLVNGRVSYASQEPWLFNGSIRDNILFGEIYNGDKYDKTASACALIDDFRQLPYGDRTLVGERGSNLSGGQRARVNLARAVYRDADVYLLDDPLSAVDARVGQQIMKDCINGLLRDKTRILVTHGIQQLNEVYEIILLERGKVEFRGNMEDFRKNNSNIALLLNDHIESNDNEPKFIIDKAIDIKKSSNNDNKKEPKETEELIAKGAMKSSVYLDYLKAGSWNMLFWVVVTNVLFVISVSIFDFRLGTWENERKTMSKNSSDNHATTPIDDSPNVESPYGVKQALFFGGLLILIILISIVKSALLCKLAFNASKKIHNDILSRLMTTTLRFFEANATGKILNRFSEDTGIMDNALPQALSMTINPIFHTIAMLAAAVIASWWVIIPGSILSFIVFLVGKIYTKTVQKIKRISGNAKSPILSFAASSLEGVMTIRACRAEHIVTKHFDNFQDQRTAAEFLTVALPHALFLWMELINIGFLAVLTYIFVYMKNDETNGSYVSVTLMQILFITGMVSYQITQVAEILAHMTSVERMLQFKDLEQESSIEDKPIAEIPSFWPDKGKIVFEHLYLRYTDHSEPVLWDLNCYIEPGSKIGIVGRTGAGKSSIISALFRFAKFDGFLFIDGLNIKGIPLYVLRSKISVIPQEPILFKASLRKNLDPLDKFDDSILYSALESVELKSMFNTLDTPIERGGSNMSVGQRQLLCLARAIVNRNKILILDEATANIDSSTDALIQKTIRNEFKDCTVLTIAHRLNTVMDSDKILVMDDGRLVEYDHPFILLQNKESHLFKMIEQGSEAAIKNLTNIAEQAYINLTTSSETFQNGEIQHLKTSNLT